MIKYKFDGQKNILWSEQIDEKTHQSGFILVGKAEYKEIIDSGVEIAPHVEPEKTHAELKLKGVEFEGVMCSATKDDQFGLASLESRIKAGESFNFHFENGSKLTLTPDNFEAFSAVWYPFRLGFFK